MLCMNAFLQQRRPRRINPRTPPPVAPREGSHTMQGIPCRSDALVAITPRRPPPIAPRAGLPQNASRSAVGATPPSRSPLQTTTHRPEGGAPTKCRASPVGATPPSRSPTKAKSHREVPQKSSAPPSRQDQHGQQRAHPKRAGEAQRRHHHAEDCETTTFRPQRPECGGPPTVQHPNPEIDRWQTAS